MTHLCIMEYVVYKVYALSTREILYWEFRKPKDTHACLQITYVRTSEGRIFSDARRLRLVYVVYLLVYCSLVVLLRTTRLGN